MIKPMLSRFGGYCSRTGAAFPKGTPILYDTVKRTASIQADLVAGVAGLYVDANPRNVSDVIRSRHATPYFRNKAGRCEDAPACGCCTI